MNLKEFLSHATRPENDAYHASEGLSWSRFSTFINVSPMQFRHEQDNPKEETEPMKKGSLGHVFANEPHLFEKEYRVIENCNLGTKEGKQKYLDYLVNFGAITPDEVGSVAAMSADDKRKLMSKSPFKVVTEEDVEKAKGAALAITCSNNRIPGKLDPDLVELAFSAEINGVLCRCKTDRIVEVDGELYIYDAKFTGKDLKAWERGMEYGDYLLGDAWYRMVIEAATGYRPPPIRYVGTEINKPHDSIVRYYPDDLFPVAREVIIQNLDLYKSCDETDTWPGRDGDDHEREINVRSFTMRSMEEAAMSNEDVFAKYLLSQID